MRLSNLDDVRVFDAVARAENLTRAARALGLSKQTVSRRLTALERELGVALTQRTTRALALTDKGRAFAARCRDLVEASELATRELAAPRALTVTADRVVAASILPALISEFLVARPSARVSVRAVDARLALDEVDIAFRVGASEGTYLGPAKMITVASPRYLAGRAPTLKTLAQHALIALVPSGARAIWPLSRGGHVVPHEVDARLVTEDLALARRATLAGLGLCHLPAFTVRHEIANGALVEVLQTHAVDVGGVYAITRDAREVTRAFLEMALSHFSVL